MYVVLVKDRKDLNLNNNNNNRMRAPIQLTFLTKRQLQLNSYLSPSSTSTKSSQPAIYARVANNDGLLLHSNLYYQTFKKKKKLSLLSTLGN